jgi:F-type H+-transporting ATPase subunit delta
MATTKHNSPLSVTYAQSLLELANQRNQASDIGAELEGIGEILENEPVFRDYLADPAIGDAERTASLEKIFRGRVSELVYNFIGVLNNNGRLRILGQIVSAYDALLEEQIGNVEVDVTTAQRLSADELEQVRHKVSDTIKKNAIIHQYVDETIIGGLVIRIGDKVIDASVKQQLASMRQQLMAAAQKVRG